MIAFSHYRDFIVKDPDEVPHVLGLLVKAVHSWIRYEFETADSGRHGIRQDRIAMDLPYAALPGSDQGHPRPGDVLRVFSTDPELLDKLTRYPGLLRLQDTDAIATPPKVALQDTPILGHRRWRRLRKPERATAGFSRRQARRLARRGHPATPPQATPTDDGQAVLFIRTHSTQTQQRFSLFIGVEDSNQDAAGPGLFNAYGLSVGETGHGVPILG